MLIFRNKHYRYLGTQHKSNLFKAPSPNVLNLNNREKILIFENKKTVKIKSNENY